MGFLFYPRKQTSVSYAADCDVIVCYERSQLTSTSPPRSIALTTGLLGGCSDGATKRRGKQWIKEKAQG
jgi:hypothetical protein